MIVHVGLDVYVELDTDKEVVTVVDRRLAILTDRRDRLQSLVYRIEEHARSLQAALDELQRLKAETNDTTKTATT